MGVDDRGKIIGIDKNYVEKLKKEFVTVMNNKNKINPPYYLDISSLQNSVMGFVARYQYIETDKFPPFLGISFLTENHLKILN